jgi:hypothetical protein
MRIELQNKALTHSHNLYSTLCSVVLYMALQILCNEKILKCLFSSSSSSSSSSNSGSSSNIIVVVVVAVVVIVIVTVVVI